MPTGECSSTKTLEKFDLSNNQLTYYSFFNDFFYCLRPKELILKNNNIIKIYPDWPFLDKSLKTLNLQNNDFEKLKVSLIFFNKCEITICNNNMLNSLIFFRLQI